MTSTLRTLPLLLAAATSAQAATVYEWTFDSGDLSTATGNGVMSTAGAGTPGSLAYATTDGGTVPHIGGTAASYLSVPALPTGANGLLLTFNDSGPNGGGNYINQYTLLMDVFSPGAAGWQALMNTDTSNGNDADWYISSTGQSGIGAFGYSAANSFTQNSWHRIAVSADLTVGTVKYYIDGNLAFTRTGSSQTDGRFAVFSNANAGADLLLFNEGDTSGTYTHALYVNSVAFTDQALSQSAIQSLGGPSAAGILVPEPSTSLLGLLGALGLLRRRR
ncbi:PEP-CTERM sorting domain-containing protein [Haloferula sp. BvORR071]|uniref:PEP-CTERM sorting domain-containing protein n=1 Tax=Haloferula sp. BvORR071 TaxID=1396141 RepID=UPI00054E9893|nr:PEP-CTERM sorting domain-containing protein [Haloferula sp. BvORR071]